MRQVLYNIIEAKFKLYATLEKVDIPVVNGPTTTDCVVPTIVISAASTSAIPYLYSGNVVLPPQSHEFIK